MNSTQYLAKAREATTEARGIVSRAKTADRALTRDEKARAEELVTQAEQYSEGAKTRARIESVGSGGLADASGGDGSGWDRAAKAFVKGDRHVEVKLASLMARKGVEADDVYDEATLHRGGIRPLLEDTRTIIGALPMADPGSGSLHVDEFVITSRGLAEGSEDVERDPLDTSTAKALVDIAIDLESTPLKQYAALVEDCPNQAFETIDGLTSLLFTSLGRELTKRLDSAVLEAIVNASPAMVSGGSSFLGRIRRAISDLEANGARAALAVVSPTDLEAVSMMTQDEVPIGFARDRFGLRYLAHPALGEGEGYVLDPAGIVLYRAGAKFDRDDTTGFDKNVSRVRLEFNALALVREPGRIIALDSES